jgi:hypothetical protein
VKELVRHLSPLHDNDRTRLYDTSDRFFQSESDVAGFRGRFPIAGSDPILRGDWQKHPGFPKTKDFSVSLPSRAVKRLRSVDLGDPMVSGEKVNSNGTKMFVAVWMVLLSGSAEGQSGEEDWRNIRTGYEIPSEGYCDQPYVVVTEEGNWLCTMTTGAGLEGEGGSTVGEGFLGISRVE